MPKALIADDDISAIAILKKHLKDTDLEVTAVFDPDSVIEKIKHTKYDVLISNFNLPNMTGIELTEQVMEIDKDIVILFVTSFSSIQSVMKALSKGAYNYLSKPVDKDELLFSINRGLELISLKNENFLLKEKLRHANIKYSGFESRNDIVIRISKEAAKAAVTDTPILICGEKGTGKEYFARFIHECSKRKNYQVIVLDCEKIPMLLLESEVFGHRKDAFTGAVSNHKGYLETLGNGTLILKNIQQLEIPIQDKILRFIKDREFSRIGDPKVFFSNARLIATTSSDLKEMTKKGKFRQELYNRLSTFEFNLPPIRERKDDIMFYFEKYLDYFCKEKNSGTKRISDDVQKILEKYNWKGNIPEIINIAERLAIISDASLITVDMLPDSMISDFLVKEKKSGVDFNIIKKQVIKHFEIDFIKKYLKKNNGNVAATAKEINFHEVSLRQKISKLGINPQKFKINNGQ